MYGFFYCASDGIIAIEAIHTSTSTMNTHLTRCSIPRRSLSVSLFSSCSPRRAFSNGTIEENDIVLLERINAKRAPSRAEPILSPPLSPRGHVVLSKGSDKLRGEWIIGKQLRETVRSRRGLDYRLLRPSLAEYTDLSPRLVTPIYSSDAVATLALLDLHPTTPGTKDEDGDRKLEIFEAGTGHGAFTLNLSRAVHAANTTPPTREKDFEYGSKYQTWRSNRRAVIHTLDLEPRYSAHAENMIKSFRKAMYYHNIDFHTGTIPSYLSARFAETNGAPFLDHAILDLPNCHEYIEIVAKALKPDGSLLVFVPQITQVNKCVLHCKEKDIPLFLDKVVELGGAMAVGGREWDVRPVRTRAFLAGIAEREVKKGIIRQDGGEIEADKEDDVDVAEKEHEVAEVEIGNEVEGSSKESGEGEWEMVCRPKVGGKIQGGGFVGQWRKMTVQTTAKEKWSNRRPSHDPEDIPDQEVIDLINKKIGQYQD
ncbi:hypothetical protein HYALB_00010075 [Hymenoscyphus albidus]|uniref:tRNA (adenine(58)-N(1))-methyltransferase catalytic subunit TRM61 n=1 Tax=Hymenoscyphus albidus TaxID=595503 RepID=A0A9N9LVZ7_9HELO|nr:hypothetical protein HYALB_00010075 [Hymenoscyphus albidus]